MPGQWVICISALGHILQGCKELKKEAKKEYPPHVGEENMVLNYLVNHLCGKMQPFPKRQTKLFIGAGEEKGWAHTCKTYDLSQNLEG